MIMLGPESTILVVFLAIPWVAIRLWARVPLRRAISEALCASYLVALLGVVFLPLRWVPHDNAPYLWASVNLIPLRTVLGIVRDFPGRVFQQLLGNVILFVPLGYFLPVFAARCRRIGGAVFVALVASAGIELVQFVMLFTFISQRSVDVDDVILNVSGAVVGYLAWSGVTGLRAGSATDAAALEPGA